MVEPANDLALVERMAKGDRTALAELYNRHAPRLMSLLLRMLGNRQDAQDLLHDVFLEAWAKADDYSELRGSVSVWLGLRARSRALDRLRSSPRTRTASLGEELLASLRDPAADPERTSEHARLLQSLQQLTLEEQEVIIWGYFEGLSSSEIAEQLQIPVGTVKSRTRAALSKLRSGLEGLS
ncbi:MAG TPA: sigma-70 family RNA polymerase sigma factor [Polyangiaceae bacterium]|jgi:RNA polymerase sigma-70 factor (ECF subfamily)|nr:sigma-70 family RNA polymerase sigma factor [Polyangiaceae bacterium]